MLCITDYCPEIADNLLSTIIDRAIQIDVSSVYIAGLDSPMIGTLIRMRNSGRDTGRVRGT